MHLSRRILILALAALALPAAARAESDDVRVPVRIDLPDSQRIVLIQIAPQEYRYEITRDDGRVEQLSPQEFAAAVHRARVERGWLYALLNISSPVGIAWVALGMIGQVVFAGRMVVQWIHSERSKRSVVPVVFWWMSLAGASMLLVYFIWRRDIVGILGQSMGWVIYVRNLMLIHRPQPAA